MRTINRRKFIYSAAMVATVAPAISAFTRTKSDQVIRGNIPLGVISGANNPEEDLKKVRDLGFPSCQLEVGQYSSDLARRLSKTLNDYKIKGTALICMGPGAYKWDFIDGPSTIGLVPREMRSARVDRLKQGIDFCKESGVPAVHAHFGFIPEDPKNILYKEFIDTMKVVGEFAMSRGIEIHFETGQETPITLLRAIEDIGTGNCFVNYDTANLVMYGKANPLDGIKVLGKYIKGMHAKDGMYPTDPGRLGKEVLIPTGEVDFPKIISSLKKLGFAGAITIECEMGGSNRDYILKTKNYLENLIVTA
jgi:sugar phosphate isomerase/epimerase